MNTHKLRIKYIDDVIEHLDCHTWETGKTELIISRYEGNNQVETLYFIPLTNIRYIVDEINA